MSNIWYEKYTPQTIDDVIMPDDILTKLKNYVSTKKIPNLGFWSQEPGLGKSSTAKAIIKSLDADALFVNASMERNIDVLRGKIFQFASSKSLSDDPKIVVMDECDNLTRDAQSAFRSFLDQFSGNCTFIFTGNYKSRIIEPLLDRLENYDFMEFSLDKNTATRIFNKLKNILISENIEVTDDTSKMLVKIIKNNYPKIRNMIGTLQRSVMNGKFEYNEESSDFQDIVETMKEKDYQKLIVQVNSIPNPDAMYEYLYKHTEIFRDLPKAILILAKGQFQSDQVRDKNLNLCSSLVELIPCL